MVCPLFLFRDQHQAETGPSITMSAVVSAPEMAVNIHFIYSTTLLSLERSLRLCNMALPRLSVCFFSTVGLIRSNPCYFYQRALLLESSVPGTVQKKVTEVLLFNH